MGCTGIEANVEKIDPDGTMHNIRLDYYSWLWERYLEIERVSADRWKLIYKSGSDSDVIIEAFRAGERAGLAAGAAP